MTFETFKRQRVPLAQEPYVTLHRRGTIALNTPAFELLGAPAAVELLFDREKAVMGLRGIDETAGHAYRLRQNGTSASSYVLSGTAFFQYYGIPLVSEARRLAAELDDGILTVDLTQAGETSARPPSKSGVKRFPKPIEDL